MSLSLLTALATAVVWTLVTGQITAGQMLVGLVFGALFVIATGFGRGRTLPLSQLPRRLFYLGLYLLVLLPFEIVRSNLDVARRLLRPRPSLHPGIVRFELGPVSETASAAITHAVTVGPGEMVVDVSTDGRTVYVHLIDATSLETEHFRYWRLYQRLLQRVFT